MFKKHAQHTVFATVAAVESSGIDVVQSIDTSTVPQQSFNLLTGLTVFKHHLFVLRVQLPQPVILYSLNLPQNMYMHMQRYCVLV